MWGEVSKTWIFAESVSIHENVFSVQDFFDFTKSVILASVGFYVYVL